MRVPLHSARTTEHNTAHRITSQHNSLQYHVHVQSVARPPPPPSRQHRTTCCIRLQIECDMIRLDLEPADMNRSTHRFFFEEEGCADAKYSTALRPRRAAKHVMLRSISSLAFAASCDVITVTHNESTFAEGGAWRDTVERTAQ